MDVGCEDGWIAEGYADAVTDRSSWTSTRTCSRASRLAGRPGVRAVVGDATTPGAWVDAAGRGRADVVVLSALLEHLPAPDDALCALAPLLAPAGRFVVYVPADGPILLAKRILRSRGWAA